MNQIVEANGRELFAIELLSVADKQLFENQEVLKERLKLVPNGWRNYRLAVTTVEKVLDGIYETLPSKTMAHMERLATYGQINIRPRPVIKIPDSVQIMGSDELKVIINHAIENTCTICVKDHKEQKKCPLRKSLLHAAPTGEIHKDGRCTYMDVVAGNELGKYI